jgi:hypothetical protein
MDTKELIKAINKKVELALIYLEDGAFATARQRLLEAADLLPVSSMRMINGHPNGDPMNDPPSLR